LSANAAQSSLLSIGEVLSTLRPEFPDVTISKIRFLETEGLVMPSRTPSGYRKFSHADVERLRYVLGAQKEHYLPLKVIKEHLEAIDRGLEPPASKSDGPRVPRSLVSMDAFPSADEFRPQQEVRLTRQELLDSSGLSSAQLEQLESYGLVTARRKAQPFDAEDLVVARTVAEMASYGLEARHLRSFKAAADREAGLVEQVTTPYRGSRDPDARSKADEVVRELAALSVRLHAALVKSAIARDRRR
jgi:DNA-binding transcriptional MerR regulator